MRHPTIRPLESCDMAPISATFSCLGWNKPRSHIDRRYFDGAPSFLGLDDRGREVLTSIPGMVGNYPPPQPITHHRWTPPSLWTRNSRKPENSCSHLSLLTWSNPASRSITPVDNSQNPTNKAKNRASQAAAEVFPFV